MTDSQGRTIDYMRFSITDRCNLRCKYCMPHGVKWASRWEILSLEEICAVAMAGAALGIKKIKVTGGEPLVRKDCCQLVSILKRIPGIEKVTITTNGVLLEEYLDPLLEAGIDGINISLDTLDRETYQNITGQDGLERVLAVLRTAAQRPVPVKVNAVLADFRQGTERKEKEDWEELAELARDLPVDVRFIEMMPIGYGKGFPVVDYNRMFGKMKEHYPDMERDDRIHGFGPAVYYRIPGFKGSVGWIRAIHGKFCKECNRVRVTSKGYLKSCLCYEDGVDLRAVLRNGGEAPEADGHYRWPLAEDFGNAKIQEKLCQVMRKAIWEKPASHCFERPEGITEEGNMVDIGG